MGNIQGQFDVGSFYNITAAAPLDVRTLVKTESDLIAEDSWNKKTHPPYKGMMVTVQETGNVYTLIDVDNVHSIDGWKKVGSDLDLSEELNKILSAVCSLDFNNNFNNDFTIGFEYDDTRD